MRETDYRAFSRLTRRLSERERFWLKVQVGPGCWTWTGSVNRLGYGLVRINGDRQTSRAANRVAYEYAYNVQVPDDKVVCHRCDNPSCVRPDHLYVGTPADNSRDMQERNRARTTLDARVCKNGHALTPENVMYSRAAEAKYGRRKVCRICWLAEREGRMGTGRSKYRGVSWNSTERRWAVFLRHDGKAHFGGYFDDEIEAARKYDAMAREHFKDFARCNFPVATESSTAA